MEELRALEDQRRIQREKEDEELRKLKEKQVQYSRLIFQICQKQILLQERRRKEREEEERKMEEMKQLAAEQRQKEEVRLSRCCAYCVMYG